MSWKDEFIFYIFHHWKLHVCCMHISVFDEIHNTISERKQWLQCSAYENNNLHRCPLYMKGPFSNYHWHMFDMSKPTFVQTYKYHSLTNLKVLNPKMKFFSVYALTIFCKIDFFPPFWLHVTILFFENMYLLGLFWKHILCRFWKRNEFSFPFISFFPYLP